MQPRRVLERFIRFSAFMLATMLLASMIAVAQSDTGSLTGIVKDQNGAIVPGASVTARNQRTGDERTATTNSDGTFSIPALKASAYTVTATSTGLSASIKDVQVSVGRESNLSIGMKLGDLTASVNIVDSQETTIATGSASMGANVNPREVEGLPISGRQLSQLYLQAPGSVNTGRAHMATFVFRDARSSRMRFALTALRERRLSIRRQGILTARFRHLSGCSHHLRTCRSSASIRITIRLNLGPALAVRLA